MKVAGALLVLGILAILIFYRGGDKDGGDPPDPGPGLPAAQEMSDSGGSGSKEVRLIASNPFIEDYGREGGSTETDLASLRDVVRDCQLLLKDFDRYHLPGNPEITGFLQGNNPDGLAWIPSGHRMVSDEGELVDRQGTPVFFHRLSGMRFEYRSAGPDRQHWTDDDVVVK